MQLQELRTTTGGCPRLVTIPERDMMPGRESEPVPEVDGVLAASVAEAVLLTVGGMIQHT